MGDVIYLTGGYDGNTEYSLCESYVPAAARQGLDPWRNHAAMNASRAGHGVAVSQGSLYVVGGGWETSYLAYNERYDMANDAWSTFESPIIGQWRALGISTVASREGNFLYAIGGWNEAIPGRSTGATRPFIGYSYPSVTASKPRPSSATSRPAHDTEETDV